MDTAALGRSESIQEALRLGGSKDIYYYTSATLMKQSIHTIVDNRFFQALTSLGAGSSTFIISIDQGISDIILGAKLPEQGDSSVDYTGLALPRGWLYSLISRVSVRYGSSSQFFWSGQQMLVENLREMPNPDTRDQLYALGGALMRTVAGADPFSGDNLFAYAYINLPHNSPNGGLMKPNPFPSELIGQPIVITLELNTLQNIFSSNNALGDISGAPTALKNAFFQVKQIHAKDAGELMQMPGGRGSAYSFPTKAFYQNEVKIQVGSQNAVSATPTEYQLQLTGFRNGEVRSVIMWITRDGDTNPATNAAFVKNYDNFILARDVELLYNGTVYYRAPDISSQMWALCSTKTPPQLECTVLSISGGSIVSTSKKANWIEIPFSQVYEQLSGSHMYVAGKLIQNAVVNMQVTLPDTDRYTCHFTYSYNCAIMISDRAAEYVF